MLQHNEMFFFFSKEIVRSRRWASMTPTARAVFPVLAAHCDANGTAYPGRERIARLAGIDIRSVAAGTTQLVKAGLVSRVSKKYSRTGRWQNVYHLRLPRQPGEGETWLFHHHLVTSGRWAELSTSAKSTYVALRTLAHFDGASCHDLEDDYDLCEAIRNDLDAFNEAEYPDGFAELFPRRSFDLVLRQEDAHEVVGRLAGIQRSTLQTALAELIGHCLVAEAQDCYLVLRLPSDLLGVSEEAWEETQSSTCDSDGLSRVVSFPPK